MEYHIISPLTHKKLIGKEEEILDLYYNQKKSFRKISSHFKVTKSLIGDFLRDNNFHIKSVKEYISLPENPNPKFGDYLFRHPKLLGKDEEVKDLYLDGYSANELTKMYGVADVKTISWWLSYNGIPSRDPVERRNTDRVLSKLERHNIIEFEEDDILKISKLYTEGYGATEIGNMYDCDMAVIRRTLKENNVPFRSKNYYTQRAKDKAKETVIANYGGYHGRNKVIQQQFMDKYDGATGAMQVPEFFHKQQASATRLKTAIIDDREIIYQGYELMAINLLLKEGYELYNIKNGKGKVPNFRYFFDGKYRRYYPDIHIPNDDLIIEVKSDWTYNSELDKNLAKKEAVIDAGYNFQFYIMNKHGNRILA